MSKDSPLCVSKDRLLDCADAYALYNVTREISIDNIDNLLTYIAVYPVHVTVRAEITAFYIGLVNELDDHEYPVDTFLEIAAPQNVTSTDIKTLEKTLKNVTEVETFLSLLMFTAALAKTPLLSELATRVYTSLILFQSCEYDKLMLIGEYIRMPVDVLGILTDNNVDHRFIKTATEIYVAQKRREGLVTPEDVSIEMDSDFDMEFPEDTYPDFPGAFPENLSFPEPFPYRDFGESTGEFVDDSGIDTFFSGQDLVPAHRTTGDYPMNKYPMPKYPMLPYKPNPYKMSGLAPELEYPVLQHPAYTSPYYRQPVHTQTQPTTYPPDYRQPVHTPYRQPMYPPMKGYWHSPLTFNDAVHSAANTVPEPPLDKLFFNVSSEDIPKSDISVA